MSEFLSQLPERSAQLLRYCERLIAGENGKMLFEAYRPLLENVTAAEVMEALDGLLQKELPFESVKAAVGKIMNAAHASLQMQPNNQLDWPPFLKAMAGENRWAEQLMQAIKATVKSLSADSRPELREALKQQLGQLKSYDLHYLKKENILFPYLERRVPAYRCIQLMWAFHDDFRQSLKALDLLLDNELPDSAALSQELGRLFFVVLPILFREEKVLLPVALLHLQPADWEEMLRESHEIGWCGGVEVPVEIPPGSMDSAGSLSGLVDLSTGALSAEQLVLMLESLPIDITYIDENDEVRYFSGAKHRIFTRSKAIIGRKVQNCHPQSSLHMVNEIVDAFRKGERDSAEFWIQMRGRFVHIRYFALRNTAGDYRGTIEVSQDVTDIRSLEGERRLLQWS